MARSRDNTRFNRYLAKRRRQELRGQIPSQRDDGFQGAELDVSERLMQRAISRDQNLDLLFEVEPAS